MPAQYPSAIVTSWRTSWRKLSYFCWGSRTAWLASRLGRFHALDRSWFDVPPRVVETRGCGLIPKPMPDEAPATSSSRPAKAARGSRVGARALGVRARASTALVAGAPAPLGTASTIPSARCRGEVRSRAPVSLGSCTDARRAAVQPPSSSGRGRRPFKAVTRVRIPLGVLRSLQSRSAGDGPVGCASPTRGAVTDHEFVSCSLVGWGHRPAGGGETSSSRMWQHPSAGRRSPLLSFDPQNLQEPLNRVSERANLVAFTPFGRARALAACALREAVDARASGYDAGVRDVLARLVPESPDAKEATVASCIGISSASSTTGSQRGALRRRHVCVSASIAAIERNANRRLTRFSSSHDRAQHCPLSGS